MARTPWCLQAASIPLQPQGVYVLHGWNFIKFASRSFGLLWHLRFDLRIACCYCYGSFLSGSCGNDFEHCSFLYFCSILRLLQYNAIGSRAGRSAGLTANILYVTRPHLSHSFFSLFLFLTVFQVYYRSYWQSSDLLDVLRASKLRYAPCVVLQRSIDN